MFEVSREKSLREIQRIENDEAVISRAPSNQRISQRIVDHLISFQNERRYNVVSRIALHPITSLILSVFFYFFLLLSDDDEEDEEDEEEESG